MANTAGERVKETVDRLRSTVQLQRNRLFGQFSGIGRTNPGPLRDRIFGIGGGSGLLQRQPLLQRGGILQGMPMSGRLQNLRSQVGVGLLSPRKATRVEGGNPRGPLAQVGQRVSQAREAITTNKVYRVG